MSSDVNPKNGILYPVELANKKRLILDNIGAGIHEVKQDLEFLIGPDSLMELSDECNIITDQILSEISSSVVNPNKVSQILHNRVLQIVMTAVRGSIHISFDWMEHRLGENNDQSGSKETSITT